MFLVIKTVKKVDGGAYSVGAAVRDDIGGAKKKFYTDLSETVGNALYSYAMECILDEDGKTVLSDYWYSEE